MLQIKRGIVVKLTANELLMGGDHKNIKEPSGGSGKFQRDITKSSYPPLSHRNLSRNAQKRFLQNDKD